MNTLLRDFVKNCERFGFQNSKNTEFVKWSRTHFPEVTDFAVSKEGEDTLVNGLTWDKRTLYTMRYVPVTSPPARMDGEYVYLLWDKHGEQRIHVSEFQDFFGDWIREKFPKTKYVYINAYQPNKWVVSLDSEFTFEVACQLKRS